MPGRLGPCLTLLQDLGYEAFFLQAGRLEVLGSRRITDVQGEKLAGRGAYIYDFVFVHQLDGWTRSRLRERGYL